MTNEEKAKKIAELHGICYKWHFKYESDMDSTLECYASAIEMAEWKDQQFAKEKKQAEKEFAKKVKKVSIDYKYSRDLALKANVQKEIIYDRLLIHLIEGLKRDGFIEIKETQEDDVSTIFMCVNVLKNDFKQTMEE